MKPQKEDDYVCEICGDIGWKEVLLTCSICKGGHEHAYCTRFHTLKIPEYWVCEPCQQSQCVSTSPLIEDQGIGSRASKTYQTNKTAKVKSLTEDEVIRLSSGASHPVSSTVVLGKHHRNDEILKKTMTSKHASCSFSKGIMAAVGSSGKDVYLELRRKRVEEEKKSGGSSGRTKAEGSSQRGDLLPPPVEKKSKRRDRLSKPGTPRPPSPKKTQNDEEGNKDSLSALFDSQLKINEGIKVSLSSEEAEIVSAIHPKVVLYALNEFQARTMVMGRHLETVFSKLADSSRLAAEIETLQRDLAEVNHRRQEVSMQLENVKNERSQLLAERNALKARCKELEMKDEESRAALEQLEGKLSASKAEHTSALERIYELEGYVMPQHEEGFYKAIRQAAYLFNFDAGDDRIDIKKDVYDGVLMSIEDIVSAKAVADDPEKVSSPPTA